MTGALPANRVLQARLQTYMQSESEPKPLHIAIIGAGIAGLTAAVAFRKEGHTVEVFESAAQSREIGAALALTANAIRVLRYLGLDMARLRACDYLGVTWFSGSGGEEGKFDPLRYSHTVDGVPPGIMCHRSDLHSELKRLATLDSDGAPGTPATIRLKSQVVSCDCERGIVTLANGETVTADVVVGSDGIRSTIRTSILGHEQSAPPSGRAAFRAVIETATFRGHPELEWLFQGTSGPQGIRAPDGSSRYLFVYPCRDETLINIVAHYPDERNQDDFDWNITTTKSAFLSVYADFAPQYTAMLSLIPDTAPVHLWQIRALPLLPRWTRGRAALIGDAAHATFPTMGQGAGISIEDAVTLSLMLPRSTSRDEIEKRLEAYEHLRKARGEFVLTESVEQVMIKEKWGLYSRSEEMQATLIGHDAVALAKEYFKEHFESVS
ncbi:hypothetical protein C8F01DRAFT_1145259 [Mycena amicta]|nr:hypothetical protein C8F01DRAFT_1145259 [Mycena amicta]